MVGRNERALVGVVTKGIWHWVFLAVALVALGCSATRPAGSGADRSSQAEALLKEELARSSGDESELPKSAMAHYNFIRGQLALDDENYGEALQYLKQAVAIDQSPAPTLRRSIAQLYLRTGKLDEALAEIDRALQTVPDDLELLQLRAGILATKRDVPEAIAAYRKVIDANPDVEDDPYVLIASLYAQENDFRSGKAILRELVAKRPESFFGHYYLGRMAEADGDFTQAETSYRRAVQLNPQADSVLLDLARVYGTQKRFKEAIAICESVIRDNPKNVAARNMLAQLHLASNNVDKALEELGSLGKLEEDPTETRLKIALIKLQRRDLEDASNELNLILAEHPNNATARYYLASAYAGLKRVEDSLEQIRKLDAGSDYFVESRILGAFVLQQEKRYADGIALVDEALKQRPEDLKLLSLRASLQRESGDVDGATATQRRIIALEPASAKNYFSLGVYLDENGKKAEAMEAMRKAIELDPKHANALNYLGYSLVEKGENLGEAESLIRQALEIEKDNGYFLDSLGWLYYRQGRYQEAARELERAAQLVGTDAVILEHHALAELKLGNKKKAIGIFKRALQHAPESDDKNVSERIKAQLKDLGVE